VSTRIVTIRPVIYYMAGHKTFKTANINGKNLTV